MYHNDKGNSDAEIENVSGIATEYNLVNIRNGVPKKKKKKLPSIAGRFFFLFLNNGLENGYVLRDTSLADLKLELSAVVQIHPNI